MNFVTLVKKFVFHALLLSFLHLIRLAKAQHLLPLEKALRKTMFSGIFANKKALLIGELAACTPERSKSNIKSRRDNQIFL